MDDIVLKIKSLLKSKNMTYEQFAVSINVTRQTVHNYMNGRSKIDVVKIQDISKVLEVPVSYFFNEEANLSNNCEERIKELEDKIDKLKFLLASVNVALVACDPKYAKRIDKLLEDVMDW
jgi:transcriptional regulator with XRE-family HTH domain